VGLVGFPSVGKSTLLAAVSNAKPEIADYHFTTIVPNLGIVAVKDGRSFVMADLPGLIEGAHQGKGLGLRFLRHIERCRVLIHVVDISSSEGRDPVDDFEKINLELKEYGMNLMQRPMIVAANKMDDDGAILLLEEFKKKYADKYEIFPISALTRQGIDALLYRVADLLSVTPEFSLIDENNLFGDKKLFEYVEDDKGFVITRPKSNYWLISGERVEKLYNMTNISTDEGLLYLTSILRKMGVEKELIDMGIQDGDTVKLCDFEFTFFS
jgi:GTPase